MATPSGQFKRSPPIPAKGKRRKQINPLSKRGSLPPMSTLFYSSAAYGPPASRPRPITTMEVEDLFADAFAHDCQGSDVSRITRGSNFVFDEPSVRSQNRADSLVKPISTTPSKRVSLLENVSHEVVFDQPSASTSHETFPAFTNNTPQEGVTQMRDTADRCKGLGQRLIDQLRGARKRIRDLDDKFEVWTWEQRFKRAEKNRMAAARRDSLARAKALDDQHRAQIELHREREKTRNKRAQQKIQAQKKEIKEQEKRRDQAAKGIGKPLKFKSRLGTRIYNSTMYGFWDRNGPAEPAEQRRSGQNGRGNLQRTVPEGVSPPVTRPIRADNFQGYRETSREVEVDSDDQSLDSDEDDRETRDRGYVIILGAEEHELRNYGRW